ncbi:MAG TPA: RecX family transcriptional regulator [Chloroflexi bacterium]|nr:RecX family transcriptional regulator [Chloroflexota bacterium]
MRRDTTGQRRQPREERPIAAGTITQVQATQRDPERVSVFIDGVFALALPAIVAVQRGLRSGVELDEAAVRELEGLAEAERATEAAVTFVAYRPRSEREVRDRLRRREFAPSAIDAAIERLRGWNYLDDRAFAEYWVENRAEHSPRGRRALEAELRAKGVDRDVTGDVLEEIDLGEEDAALALARKRLPRLSALDEPTQRRRLAAFLGRRGYEWDVIRPVLDRLYGPGDDGGEGEESE